MPTGPGARLKISGPKAEYPVMTRAPVLVHIGYHKTATSSLQQQLFSAPDAPFATPHGDRKYILSNRIVLPQPMTYDPAETREMYESFLKKSQDSGQVPVFSHERFSGYPASGGFDSTIIADRLQRTFPDAYILVVFREQLSSILSMYSQYITDGGHGSLKTYLSEPEPNLRRAPMFSEEFYRYHRLFKFYQDKFGKDRVLGLAYEQFISEPDSFVETLCNFVGVEHKKREFEVTNEKRSECFQILQRFVNFTLSDNQLSKGALLPFPNATRRFGKLSRPIGRIFPDKLDQMLKNRLVGRIQSRFDGAFAESNAELQSLTGLDLGQFGYQLPSTTTAV
ncbi:sulfotransferase [Ruegeria arenilitoris]|uniref:sulfotransferase n=1 Tax=Ruegeria arenilitoris TaxID=1173585 RepID=UPI00147D731C|nr:sulfotransferase [Ruegeria arenilitoris]